MDGRARKYVCRWSPSITYVLYDKAAQQVLAAEQIYIHWILHKRINHQWRTVKVQLSALKKTKPAGKPCWSSRVGIRVDPSST